MDTVKIRVSDIGYVSLVGIIGNDYPKSYGNYFSCGGYHMLNMWYENLKHLIKIGTLNPDDEIDGVVFGGGIVITDKKIPEGYLNKKMCFTGSHKSIGPMKELYQFFYRDILVDGCLCTEKTGMVSHTPLMFTMGDYHIKLTRGVCDICKREIFTNNGKEVSQSEFDTLHAELNELMNPK